MTASILVATPNAPFGELLRMSLEESGQYQVRLVQSGKEARSAASRISFQLAILDSSLGDEPFVPLCLDLINQQSGLRTVVIPPENNPNHPALGGLMPHGYLSRPFYLPDLINTVARLLSDREHELRQHGDLPAATAFSVTLPPWLQEPLTLTAYLEKELSGVQALAGIVGLIGPQPGTGVLRASAGTIGGEAAEELSQTVFRYWNRKEKTDLMRFLRLTSDKRDYLVYATQISGDLVLVLAYDNSAPLSQIRPQAKEMAQTLASLPPEGYSARPPGPSPEKEQVVLTNLPQESPPAFTPDDRPPAAADEPNTQPLNDAALRGRYAAFDEDDELLEEDELGEEAQVINLSALLGAIPSPDPDSDLPPGEPHNGGGHGDEDAELEELARLLGTPSNEDIWIIDRAPHTESPTSPRGYNGWQRAEQESPADDHPEPQEPPAPSESAPPAPAEAAQDSRPQMEPGLAHWPFFDQETVRLPGWQQEEPAPSRPGALPVDYALPAEQPAEEFAFEHLEAENLTAPENLAEAERGLETYSSEEAPEGSEEAELAGDEMPVPAHLLPQAGVPVPDPAHLPVVIGQTFPIPDPPSDPLEDTSPGVITTISQINQLEPASPAVSLLNYTCVLVPRLPQHFLTGELAEKLSQWLAQLCLSFGWRLEGIAVRPEYMQWSVQVAPAVSPGNLVRIIRQRTSFYIFNTFTPLGTDNPSGDFWATGYLIVSGPQPPSAQLLRDYIAQTRKRQGIAR